jgi:hypothetical protein
VTSAFGHVTTRASEGLSYIGEKSVDTANAVASHAQEGTLVGKTTEVAYSTTTQATSMLSGIGYSLFNKV